MKRSCIVALAVVLLMIGSVARAAEPQAISGWTDMRKDMELFKGAIKQTLAHTVLNTYLPGYGVVFMFTAQSGNVEAAQKELERALRFITPTISSLPEGEKIAAVGYYDGFSEWELIYVSNANTSGDPATWDVYLNRPRK